MHKYSIVLLCALLLGVIGLWSGLSPNVTASVAHQTYQRAHYRYTVETDQLYDAESGTTHAIGTIISIDPDHSTTNSSQFSDSYLKQSRAQAEQWVIERATDDLIDLLLVFKHPLPLEEVNEILKSTDAHVFESGLVGYGQEMPFAKYNTEKGPLLTRSLTELAEEFKGVVTEITDEHPTEEGEPADIRGFMAVRAWVPVKNLQPLLSHEAISIVDITPQAVREELATDEDWQGSSINVVAIEMPVWAYPW